MFGISDRAGVVCSSISVALAGVLLSACLERPLCADCVPETTNLFINRVPTGGVKKVDLLFMIDGSASMADKQILLSQAVPSLLSRFLNPLCLNDAKEPVGKSISGECLQGTPEFPPVLDLHVGVISSSLGSLTGDGCTQGGRSNDDRAWLLPRARPDAALASYQGLGFLAWDPTGTKKTPPGTSDPSALSEDFEDMVAGVKENGCGYEASLESWYRFLIDPDPPERIERQNDVTIAVGTDVALLQQREHFLRPDSLVAIVMLTDENDCSLRSTGSAWLATQSRHPTKPNDPWRMPRGTAACSTNPNDVCCRSCESGELTPPPGCTPLGADPACKLPPYMETEDPLDLRCYDQKRRFGIDLLEPVEKYVRGLTALTVIDRHGQERENPLFARRTAAFPRETNQVFLAGIVGVPWQSIATADSLTGPGLRYLRAKELAEQNRWDLILGDPSAGRLPTDPHMIESVAPRSGSHPLLPTATIVPATSTNPRADVISGHEQAHPSQGDLQYACIFGLEPPRDCTQSNADCDCAREGDVRANRPLCQPPGGGPAGYTQYFAKAYPGLRQLQVLRGLGDQAVVASICPKVARSNDASADPSYGYNPAMDAIVSSMAVSLANQCLGRAPAVNPNGQLSCVVAEAQIGGTCACTGPGRSPARPDILRKIREDLRTDGLCDSPGGQPCSGVCGCEIAEAQGEERTACQTQANPSNLLPGYCYIDPSRGLGSAELVKDCPGTKKRMLRFVGPDTPTPGAHAFMACMGANVSNL